MYIKGSWGREEKSVKKKKKLKKEKNNFSKPQPTDIRCLRMTKGLKKYKTKKKIITKRAN